MGTKKGAFMARGRHRGLGGKLPQTAPPRIRHCLTSC